LFRNEIIEEEFFGIKNEFGFGTKKPATSQQPVNLTSFMFVTAWVFEARFCTTLLNEIKKTKL
jgi:hypothetical protein